jgi:hypothetical protein
MEWIGACAQLRHRKDRAQVSQLFSVPYTLHMKLMAVSAYKKVGALD